MIMHFRIFIAVLFSSVLWTFVVLTLMHGSVFTWPTMDAQLYWSMYPASLLTSTIVWGTFRRRLTSPRVFRDWSLPLLTIAVAAPVWTLASYGIAWAREGFGLSGHPFDGFPFMLVMSLFVGFTTGLILTYPAAYLTQSVFGLLAKR
jgi:hypothetical protein